MAEKNKVTFGLQDVHWAEVTSEGSDGALTYGNVERLRGLCRINPRTNRRQGFL